MIMVRKSSPIYIEASEFTNKRIALVRAYNPLAENNGWDMYINQKDEIVDDDFIERYTRPFNEQFSKVNPAVKYLALAVKKDN